MSASRTIIVPPYRATGTLPLAVVVGAAASGFIFTIPTLDSLAPVGWGPAFILAILPLIIFGPIVAFAIALARRVQRPRLFFFVGFCLTVTQLLTACLILIVLDPVQQGSVLHPASIAIQAALGAVGGGVSLAVLWLVRNFFFTLTEQDGGYCWRCGYQLGAPAIVICPECATPRDETRYRLGKMLRVLDSARRFSRPVLIALLAVACLSLPIAVYRSYPTVRFLARFGAWVNMRNRVPAAITIWNAHAGLAQSCDAAGAILRINDGTSRVLVVSYNPRPPPGLPPMQIQLAVESRLPNGDSVILYGLPLICCDLDANQADSVIRNGLPGPLIRELTSVASRSGWVGNGGAGDPRYSRPADERIEPGPFFPSSASTTAAGARH